MKKLILILLLVCLIPTTASAVILVRRGAVDVTAPEFSSASIGTDGETVTINFNENVTGTENDTFTLDCAVAGDPISLTYSSGSGGTALVFTAGDVLTSTGDGESCTLDFDGDADDFEDDAGNDLADFDTEAVTNNSEQSSGTAIETLYPASTDVVAQWTPSAATDHYSLVDEVTTDDDDYLSDNQVHVELWNLTNTSDSSGKTIVGITLYARVKSASCSGTTDVHLHLFTSSAYYDGSTESSIGETYETISWERTTDPSDSNAWTSAEIDALWVGLENTGAGGACTITCSQFWVEVEYEP